MTKRIRSIFGISDGAKGILVLIIALVGAALILSGRFGVNIPFLTPTAEKVAGK